LRIGLRHRLQRLGREAQRLLHRPRGVRVPRGARAHRHAAVDDHVRAGDEASRVAGQVEHGRGDVLGPADAARRLQAAAALGQRGGHLLRGRAVQAEAAAEDRGGDEARHHRVDADAVPRQVGRAQLAEVQHRRLGGGIGHRRVAGGQRRDRRGVDDGAAATGLEVRQRVHRAAHHRAQQQVHRRVPAFERHLLHAAALAAGAGVVEDDVQAAESGCGAVHRGLDLRRLGDVAMREFEPALEALLQRGASVVLDVGGKYPRAFGDEQFRGGQADARARAGDECDLVVEACAHAVSRWMRTQVATR